MNKTFRFSLVLIFIALAWMIGGPMLRAQLATFAKSELTIETAKGKQHFNIEEAVTPQQMATAEIVHTAPVAPTQTSVLGSSTAAAARPPRAMTARPVATKATPPPAPVSFAAQQSALAQNGGRPLAPAQLAQIRQQQPAAVTAQAVRPAMAARPAAAQPSGRSSTQQQKKPAKKEEKDERR